LLDRLETIPGVRSATLATFSPLSGTNVTSTISVQGYAAKEHENMSTENLLVGPHYAETMGMTLLQGREFGWQDVAGAPKVAMVNETFVRHYFAHQNPIGQHFGFGGTKNAGDMEIVGVLKDANFSSAKEKPGDVALLPILADQTMMALFAEVEIRTAGDPLSVAPQVRQALAEVDSKLAISDVKSLRQQADSTFNQERLAARLIGFFGVLALILACVGLYGVVAQGVTRRTNEIGVRMALGAQRESILWMILRDTLILLFIGLAIGIPVAFGAARLIASQLFGLGAADIFSFVFAAAILAAVAAIAGFVPARRATRVDPMIALHYE
ncbi:MAG: FtsX-like permease family protein, partial [Bryobacteraceae bacterium]